MSCTIKKQSFQERELDEMEADFPRKSGEAFSMASKRALAAGLSVTQVKGRTVFRIAPDGKRTIVKRIPAPFRVQSSSMKFRIV